MSRASEFYLHEDEWGMISLEPEENRFERTKVVDEARAHGEAHRAPDGVGWTAMYVAPAAPVAIAIREITVDALAEALGGDWQRIAKLNTGYSSYREGVATGYAFQLAGGPVIYGCVADGVVSQINITQATEATAAALHRLGSTFRLVLCDLWRDAVIDLANRAAVEAHIAAGDDD